MSPQQVKDLRNRLDLTQAEFASALGMARLTVSQYETGFREPKRISLLLLKVLDSLPKNRALELVGLFRSHSESLIPEAETGAC